MDKLKVLIHGVDVTAKVNSIDARPQGFVAHYVNGAIGSFNRSDIQIINESGHDIAKVKELK